MMWGCQICPEVIPQWQAQVKHTPPYISSTPSVMHFSVQKGDILVFSSDGLRSSVRKQGVPDQDVTKMIVSLAGMDMLDAEDLSSCKKAIGRSFLSATDIEMLRIE